MPTQHRQYPNGLNLASPNTPHTHINALAEAIDRDVDAVKSSLDAAIDTVRNGERMTIGGLGRWSDSSLTLIRRGNTFTVTGTFSNREVVSGYNENVLYINNSRFKPSATVSLPAVCVIAGNPAPYQGGAAVTIEASGNVHVFAPQNSTAIYLMGAYLI